MKKLLVGLLTLTTATGFAAGEHMIKLDGCLDDGRCSTLDFNMASDDTDSAEDAKQTIALNYAYNWGMWGAGLTYVTASDTTDGDISDNEQANNFNTVGLSFYWNKDGSWADSCFAALHHTTTSYEESDATATTGNESVTTIGLEAGHRYALGKAMFGMTVNWVPSVYYNMTTTVSNDDSKDDVKSTELKVNVANFAVTF